MPNDHVIKQDRILYCDPNKGGCGYNTMHECTSYPDMEYRRCHKCNLRTQLEPEGGRTLKLLKVKKEETEWEEDPFKDRGKGKKKHRRFKLRKKYGK